MLLFNALDVGDVSQFRSLWLYWTAPLFGSFIGAAQYRFLYYFREYREEKEEWVAPEDFGVVQ